MLMSSGSTSPLCLSVCDCMFVSVCEPLLKYSSITSHMYEVMVWCEWVSVVQWLTPEEITSNTCTPSRAEVPACRIHSCNAGCTITKHIRALRSLTEWTRWCHLLLFSFHSLPSRKTLHRRLSATQAILVKYTQPGSLTQTLVTVYRLGSNVSSWMPTHNTFLEHQTYISRFSSQDGNLSVLKLCRLLFCRQYLVCRRTSRGLYCLQSTFFHKEHNSILFLAKKGWMTCRVMNHFLIVLKTILQRRLFITEVNHVKEPCSFIVS